MHRAVLAALALFASGCASMVRDAPSQEIAPPGPGNATLVFMRTSTVNGGVGCELFEVVNGELRFIGQLPTGKKMAYETSPGQKVFMAYGTGLRRAADFMLADLAPGRTYYSIVRPNWGTGGFAPTPIRNRSCGRNDVDVKSSDFQAWISGTKLIEFDQAAGAAWFAENKQRLQEIYTDYWSRFERKSPSEKLERTLLPEDGQP